MSEKPAIPYGELIKQDGYVTLISHIFSPSGMGEFEVRISGQLEPVLEFQNRASFTKLDLIQKSEAQYSKDAAIQMVLDARRKEWLARLEDLRAFVGSAKFTELNDPDLICHFGQPPDKDSAEKNSEANLQLDRLIEIRPLGVLDPDKSYLLSFTIDPEVQHGRRDIYRPVIQGGSFVSALVTVTAGDADLELYRGGALIDVSRSTRRYDSVYGEGGGGDWKLHVIGYTLATYELSGDWTF